MFDKASVFNSDISKWDTSSVINMTAMFRDTSVFNSDISGWDTSSVVNMGYMFKGALVFNSDISEWDTSYVTNMESMFYSATSFNQDIREWDTTSGSVVNYGNMFTSANAFKDGDYYTYPGDDWDSAGTPNENYFNQSYDNACFLGSTKVQTNQGKIRFDELTTENTINGQKIKQVTKVINSDDNMIFIRKHAFAKKVPSQNTYISRNHGVYLDDKFIQEKDLEPQVHELIYHIAGKNLVRARNLIKMKAVTEVKRRKKDTIYNVLLETHSTMIVNNIQCETLNPNDPMVQKYIK
jgi:surface protein